VNAAGVGANDCWNQIGVQGDRSCRELERHIHCQNCEVYSAAAQALLDRPVSPDGLVEHTRHFARPKDADERGTVSVVIFRVDDEWLALPMTVVMEIVGLRQIHSLPHRRGGVVLGVTNVRGELVVCVSLAQLLGLSNDAPVTGAMTTRATHKRLMVIRHEDFRAVCPADEVDGVHRVHLWELEDLPATVGKASGRHSRAIVMWRDHAVGLLDERLLFSGLRRSLS